MLCSQIRLAVSATLDGEVSPLPPDVVAHHLGDCAGCRQFSQEATALHRVLRVRPADAEPDRTAAILSGLPRRSPVDDRTRGLRIVVLLIALVQLVASVPLLIADDHMGHVERHIGIFAVALAVGLLAVAFRPQHARALLPVLTVLVAGLLWSCLGDIWAGRPIPGSLLAHGADVAGLAAVWLLARTDPDPARHRPHHPASS